jgi:hypothetical protein
MESEYERLLEQRIQELDGMITCNNLMLIENLIWQWESFCPEEIPMEPDALFYYKVTEDGEPKAITMREIRLYAVEFMELRHYSTIDMIYKNIGTGQFYSLCIMVTDDILDRRVYEGWQELFAYTIDGNVHDYVNKEYTKFYNQRFFKLQELITDEGF